MSRQVGPTGERTVIKMEIRALANVMDMAWMRCQRSTMTKIILLIFIVGEHKSHSDLDREVNT